MKVTAKLNYLRIAPRKVRLVADLIRKKKVEEAQAILNFTNKRAAQSLLKLLNSAAANAKNNFQIEAANLYISKITVDESPKMKRWRARARGRALEIQKKSSHLTLVLEEIKPTKKIKTKKREKAKEIKEKKVMPPKTPTEKEIDLEKKEKEKAREVIRKEKRSILGMPKPKERGGIRRFFRRKSF